MGPDIGLAASAREWPDRLHRYLLDHGGGRVLARVMGPEQALEAGFEVLVIDDVCSFLTPRLVKGVREKGAVVLGVFDPVDGSDAKRRLLECGISDVVEADATPEEFLEKIKLTLAHRIPHAGSRAVDRERGRRVAVLGATDGVGATEVAVALAKGVSTQLRVVLVDLDPVWPSIAQRLDLSPHPNLRTALDRVLHGSGDPLQAAHQVGTMTVVGGLADVGVAVPPSPSELGMLCDDLNEVAEVLVADLGSWTEAMRGILRHFTSLVVVGRGDPVGVGRLLRVLEQVTEVAAGGSAVAVVNQAPRRPYHRGEIRAELNEAFPALPVVVLPFDARLAETAWDGDLAARGPFAKGMGRMADLVVESSTR
ncbi:MAG: CpaE family protein [Acidimicrobiia bacterium]